MYAKTKKRKILLEWNLSKFLWWICSKEQKTNLFKINLETWKEFSYCKMHICFSHGESLSNKMKTQTICILNRPFLLLLSEVEVDKIEIICDWKIQVSALGNEFKIHLYSFNINLSLRVIVVYPLYYIIYICKGWDTVCWSWMLRSP